MKTSYSFKYFLIAGLLVSVLLGSAHESKGQQVIYGNEWINFSQKYYKIKVPATGIYRLDRSYLQAAGINGIDPRNFQLFRRGKEVSIHVEGQADGSFDANDFIEFYGEPNDGALDRELYKDPVHHINPYYSLYTDTAAYFLTWSSVPGKRMTQYNQEPAGLTPQPWHWQETILLDNGEYARGKRTGENYMSWMDAGEGFTGGSTNGFTYNLTGMVSNLFSGSALPKVEVAFVGANDNLHDIDVFVVPASGSERLVGTVRITGYNAAKESFELQTSDFFADGKLVLRIRARNASSRFRTAYFKSIFPQRNIISAPGLSLKTIAPVPTPQYFVFEGSAAANAVGYDVTSLGNIKRIAGAAAGTQKGFVFPASFQDAYLWSGMMLVPAPAREVKFKAVAGNKAGYLIISHQLLMRSIGSSTNPVRDFATYRASAAGGGHDTLTMEVGQLYDQFFYGDKSSAAIRRFMKFMMVNGKPQFLFLIGKALETDITLMRKNPAALPVRDLVPTSGFPGSDSFFTSDWEVGEYAPKVATGRIPANNPQEVLNYLDKVKIHEGLPQNLDWRKNILHLGGGNEGSERMLLASYLRNYERVAEGKWLGANVITKIASSVAGLDTVNVSKEVNAGLSLITFFGHSSTTTSDLDIGLVSNVLSGYENSGKYPMILMNGCYVGNSFIPAKSFGEDWLLTPNKGALAFLGHASYGYPSLLNIFSSNFYRISFGEAESFGKPLGIQYQQVIREVSRSTSGDNAVSMAMQMILMSDPALQLIAPAKADYTIQNGAVGVAAADGSRVTATSESFILSVPVKNLGKVNDSPFYVSVTRTLENGAELVYDKIKVPAIYNQNTLKLELAARTTDAAGINKFRIKLDHTDTIPEISETNNEFLFEVFFSKSGLIAFAPTEYGIVSANKVKLVGQSTDLLIPARDYYFEIDTTATFRSSWKKNRVVNGAVMPTWEVQLPASGMPDSLVYFWRVRNNTFSSGEDTVWATSSFRHIPRSASGWSQANIGQLTKANLQRVDLNAKENKIEFGSLYKSILIKGGGGDLGMSRSAPFGIFIDNNAFFWDNCGYTTPNMLAIVFNNITLEPYTNMPANAGARCGLQGQFVYQFSDLSNPSHQDRLEAFLRAVPKGYHVALVGINDIPYQTFKPSLKAAFKGIGSSVIDNLRNGDPFVILGQRGIEPGMATEFGGTDADASTPRTQQAVQLEKVLTVKGEQGVMTSAPIGPAREWKSLHFQLKAEPTDSYELDIIGIDKNAVETMIATNVTASSFNLQNISATTYPHLKLRLTLRDEMQRTPPQLKHWTVLYEGLPEGLMRPDLVGLDKYLQLSSQASSGQVDLPFAFYNVSEVNFNDSLTVETTLFEENGARTEKKFKVKPLVQGDTVFFKHKFSTVSLKGTNRLRVTVNPRILPEQNYLNNTLELSFNSELSAGMPPVLDVVFDGVRILDGDLVSPSPVISMVLKDNNRKIPITNPASMKVYLKKPGADFVEIDVSSNPNVRWFPADSKSDFRVEYNPEKLENGKYTLQVQGFDALGQRAGNERYSINFEVENASTISNFYPYPNPFSSKTRFVFTLTGSTVPDKMKIQILTVTGKVIREIQKEEIGPIRIGNNVSEFAWDGTDEYGDRLANGVYLYRVIMEKGPEEMKHRYTEGDRSFKKGYGKIYILR